MARIALGITLILLLATCYFGYETKSKVVALNDNLTAAKADASSARQLASKEKADLTTAQENLTKAKSDLDDANAKVASVQGDLDASKKAEADDQTKITQLTDTIARSGTGGGPIMAAP